MRLTGRWGPKLNSFLHSSPARGWRDVEAQKLTPFYVAFPEVFQLEIQLSNWPVAWRHIRTQRLCYRCVCVAYNFRRERRRYRSPFLLSQVKRRNLPQLQGTWKFISVKSLLSSLGTFRSRWKYNMPKTKRWNMSQMFLISFTAWQSTGSDCRRRGHLVGALPRKHYIPDYDLIVIAQSATCREAYVQLGHLCVHKSLRVHLRVVRTLRFMSDINQPCLPTPFFFTFCSYVCFCLYGPFNCFSFLKFFRQLSVFSPGSSSFSSVLLVLSTIYLCM